MPAMVDWYVIAKMLHIVSSAVLFGTGLGIAFFMFRSHFTEQLNEKYYAVRTTVLADYWFTLPAVIIQPLSGIWLIVLTAADPYEFWLLLSYGLYAMAGLCWVPVVWLQIQLKRQLRESLTTGDPLPERYDRLFRLWFLLGWPAFLGLVLIFYLMVAKPI